MTTLTTYNVLSRWPHSNNLWPVSPIYGKCAGSRGMAYCIALTVDFDPQWILIGMAAHTLATASWLNILANSLPKIVTGHWQFSNMVIQSQIICYAHTAMTTPWVACNVSSRNQVYLQDVFTY